MTPEVNQILTDIGKSLSESMSEEWSSIRISVVFYSSGREAEMAFQTQAGNWKSFFAPHSVNKGFKRMRDIYRSLDQKVWGQVCYTLSSDGKFNLKFGYDNVDADGNTIIESDE